MKTATLIERVEKLEAEKKDTLNLRYVLMYRERVEEYVDVAEYTPLACRNLQRIVKSNITNKYKCGKNSTEQLEKRRADIKYKIACYYECGQEYKPLCFKLQDDYNKLGSKLAIRGWIEENASAQVSELGFKNLKSIIKAELIEKWN